MKTTLPTHQDQSLRHSARGLVCLSLVFGNQHAMSPIACTALIKQSELPGQSPQFDLINLASPSHLWGTGIQRSIRGISPQVFSIY